MSIKRIVMFIAPPGAGKGTKADMVQERRGFVHLESSKVIEDKFALDPESAEVKIAREQWLSGKLVEPEYVVRWMLERIRQLADAEKSIVFSGSPRTRSEEHTSEL